MNFPSRYRVRTAVAGDGQQVNAVFSEQSFEGEIAVAYLREPDPLLSFLREGDELVMMVVEDREARGDEVRGCEMPDDGTPGGEAQDKIVGVGGCVIRGGYVNGTPCRVGYLTGLKLLRAYRGKINFIPLIYEELHRFTKEKVDVYYTTILSENVGAKKMLEKRRKWMPEYCFLGEYHTFFCKTGKRGGCRMQEGMEIKFCSGEEAALFYLEQCEKGNLSVENVVQNDLCHADFYGLYLKGKLQAVGYVLDQRHYKQYVVDHYEGIYRVVSRLPTGLLGFPDFPKPGEAAPCAASGIWCGKGVKNQEEAAGILFRGMREKASRFNFLIIGVFEKDPLMEVFSRVRKIDYKSSVYQVRFDGDALADVKGNVRLEVGFL